MKVYDILEFNNDYKYVVFATSYENPVDEIDEIEYYLASKRYSGIVLFDLLLCNGMNSNRYIEMIFDGEHFDVFTSKVLKNPCEMIEKFIYEYLRDKPLLLKNSVLPNAQRYLLQRGL